MTTATDSFTNTNGTGLTSHDANWNVLETTDAGGTTDIDDIQSNQLRADGAQASTYRLANTGIGTDQYAKLEWTNVASGRYAGCVVRGSGQTSTRTFYNYNVDTADQGYLEKKVNGSYSLIASGGATISSTATIELRIKGTTLSVYIDDVKDTGIGDQTDSSIASGDPGKCSYNAGNVLNADNFEAGDIYTYTITANSTSYTASYQSASLDYDRIISAGSASYLSTGTDATLTISSGYILTAESGSFTYTGTSAELLFDRILTAEAGTYSYIGANANIVLGAASSVFPLSVSGRYLKTVTDDYYFWNGDAGWGGLVQLTLSEWETYLDDRVSRGFNTIVLRLIEKYFADSPPNNAYSEAPFTVAGDFTTPDDNYFDRAHTYISLANDKDVLCLVAPAYLGYNGGSQGWWSDISAHSLVEMEGYGEYIGGKFKDLPNIVWLMGGDWDGTAAAQDRMDAVVTGLSSQRADWIYTYQASGGNSSADIVGGYSWLTFNATYNQDMTLLCDDLQTDYSRSPIYSFFLFETRYENEGSPNISRLELRTQAYWSILTGSVGANFGNNPIWHFDCPVPLYSYSGTWETNLDSDGANDRTIFKTFFNKFSWYDFVPDTGNSVLTAGHGTGSDEAVCAVSSDSSTAIIYTPSQKALTVDISAFNNDIIGYWVNTATGAFSYDANYSSTTSPTTQEFTPPTSSDWVLLLGTSYYLTAESISYAVTGADAQLKHDYPLTAEPSNYTYTGESSNLNYDRILEAGIGSYALTGSAANIYKGKALLAEPGTYIQTGTASTLKVARMLACESGAIIYTGSSANLIYSGITGPEEPGLEYTLSMNLLHYYLDNNVLGYTQPNNRLHYTFRDE